MSHHASQNTNNHEHEVRRRSLPSHLLWRSILGSSAAWSGSSSRGSYLLDMNERDIHGDVNSGLVGNFDNNNNHRDGGSANIRGGGMLRRTIHSSDNRMFYLPCSLRDAIVSNDRLSNHSYSHNHNSSCNFMQLLSHPRIVSTMPSRGARSSSSYRNPSFAGRAISKSGNGISCMALDRGIGGGDTGESTNPSRYLLVGSGGGDCSISLYDLSYFGSDHSLYQQSSKSHSTTSQYSQHHKSNKKSSLAAVTHRPIARSLRNNSTTHNYSNSSHPEEERNINAISGVPTGHRHPLLGLHWYPADIYGSFVSASISGEILVWDAQNFTPVFATYTFVYAGVGGGGSIHTNSIGNTTKSVAPLQCMDLPRTPEGCPHGNALLALGLGGGGGRGVIQLCDAFRGGSATHELIGHGGGGVNAIVWDPFHPFRIASGGDDGTVRLWDVRKAGASACLGVLDRENGMYSSSLGDESTSERPSLKKQRGHMHITGSSRLEGIESHGGPVTALAFTPGGDDLVSSGMDGRLRVWDLRPDSCFVSSVAVTSSRATLATKGGQRSRMDPLVSMGGRTAPTYFTGPYRDDVTQGNGCTVSSKKRPIQNPIPTVSATKVSLAITQSGSRNTTMLWLAGGTSSSLSFSQSKSNNAHPPGSQVTGYSLFGKHGREAGGPPEVVLNGHLDDVTCMSPIIGTWDNLSVGDDGYAGDDAHSQVMLLTGGADGMVLSWGSAPLLGGDMEEEVDEDLTINSHGNSIAALLQRQCQHRRRQQLARFHKGNVNGSEYFRRNVDLHRKNNLQDKDNW